MRRLLQTVLAIAVVVTITAGCTSSASTSGSSASGSGSKETFCALLVAFRASNDSLDADVNSGDPAKAQAAVQRLVGQAKTLQQRAPRDIEPDVAVTATFLDQLDALLATYGYDLAKLSGDATGAEQFTTLNSDVVKASLGQLRAYGDTDCAPVTS